MTELTRKINDSIFGSVSTEELLANAFEKKLNYFGNNITYSPKVFIPLTTMCRDNCGYCTFVKSPKEGGTYLNQEEVLSIAEAGDEAGCYEALFTLGDKPELKWDFALTQLKELGHSSTHDYLTSSMKVVNEKFNLFPHANPGLMSRQEIKDLKNHSPSGGVMIESFSKNIYDKGKAHYKTDTKYIDLRLDTLNNALEEKYPVTTGLLLGLTSTKEEIVSGLIFDPIKDEMFFAEKDKGAFLNNQRLRVSKKNSIDDCLFSSNHEGVKFSNLNMRYSGCAALDLAYVASGRLDGFFHNKINLWDIAAGEILVKEAGGIVNDIHKFDMNKIDIKASSAAINDKMLQNLVNF